MGDMPTAGWYERADAEGATRLRWWDGSAWTDHWRDAADAPAAETAKQAPEPALAAPTTSPVIAAASPTAPVSNPVQPRAAATATPTPSAPVREPAAGLQPAPELGWMALAGAAAIVIGMLVPYWGSGSFNAALKDESSVLAMFLPGAIAAGIGAMVAMSANRAGAFVMIGYGLPFAAFQLFLIRIYSLSSDFLDVKGGFVLWTMAAAGLALLYLSTVPSARPRELDEPLVPQGWTVMALIGAGILTIGQLTPPFDGQSVWDHVSLGDGWLGFANIVLIGSAPATAVFLAIHRTQASAAAFWGCASLYFMIWFVQTARIGSSQGFQEPLLGKFPPTTVGILACIGVATIALFGPWFWRQSSADAASPAQAALILLLIAIVVMTIVGFNKRSERLDRFDFSSPDTTEQVVVT